MARVGKNLLESVTRSMYKDSKCVYREYIQNAADQIDTARKLRPDLDYNVYVTIEQQLKRITIEDNATGVRADSVRALLIDVACSEKVRGVNKGFRGIGRLGGLAYCKTLKFETSYFDEDIVSIVTWDAVRLTQILDDNNDDSEVGEVIDSITQITVKKDDSYKDKHYFKVIMEDVTDEKLLVEFVGLYPSQANFVALSYASKVKTSELAEILINNINNLSIDSYYEGWNQILGLNYILFDLAKKLDAKARSKYITKAMANREKAVKEGIFVIEKFYIGMPVIDYVMISIEDKHPWVKDKGAVIDWLNYRADMNADIKGKDWRTEWKINDLMFQAVPRYKYFAVKGTLEGLLAFTRKYLDKSAKIQDITLNNGWWLFTDEKNGLKVFLNEESGNLNIQPIE